MIDVTISLAHSHASANCASVRPVFCRVRLELLRDDERLLAELGFHDPLVLARAARVRRGDAARRVLRRQHAARERRVRRDAESVVVAGGQDLDLGLPVQQVVVRLADDRRGDALRLAFAHHLGNAPAAEVRQAEVADLAAADQVADRGDGLGQRRVRVVAVQVVDVDVVGAEPRRGCRRRPAGSSAARGRRLPAWKGNALRDLGREDPLAPARLDRGADDALGLAVRRRRRRCR